MRIGNPAFSLNRQKYGIFRLDWIYDEISRPSMAGMVRKLPGLLGIGDIVPSGGSGGGTEVDANRDAGCS